MSNTPLTGTPVVPEYPRTNLEFQSKFYATRGSPVRGDLLKIWGPISIHGALIKCPQYWLNHENGLTDRGFELRRSYIRALHAAVPLLQSGTDLPDEIFRDVVEGPGKDLVNYETMRVMSRQIGAVIRAEMTAMQAPITVMIGKMTAIARESDRRDMLVFNNDLVIYGRYYTIIRLRTLGKFSDTNSVVPEIVENNYLRALSALASCNGRHVRVNTMLLMPGNAVMPVYWVIPSDFLKKHDTTASREISKYISNILATFPEKNARAVRELTQDKGRAGCAFCQFRGEKNCSNPKKKDT